MKYVSAAVDLYKRRGVKLAREKPRNRPKWWYGARWQRLRRVVLATEPVCRMCKVRAATIVDHIVPLAHGGTHELSNLQPLCRQCHDIKTRQDAKRYGSDSKT